MKVWIVNYYTSEPDRASNPRYLQLAHYFQTKGWKVITFNADFRCPQSAPLFVRKQYGEYNFVHVKVPHYAGNGIKRMYSIWKFAQTIKHHVEEFEKPDVILHNVHAPFDYPIVKAAQKIHAKYVSEVWDLWPDNFVNFGMVSHRNPAMKLFYAVERWIYNQADQLIFTVPGALQYLQDKGWTTNTGGKIELSHVHYINNGVDLQQFDSDRDLYPRKDEDLNRNDITKVVYMGTISFANHVHVLVKAAELLQTRTNYQFFIYGDGAHRDELEKYVRGKNINNVHFKEKRIPLCEVAWVVSQATINIMTYNKGFGYMGVSSGKMFQYLAAGKPIICNVNIAYDDIITDNNLGIAKDIETPEEFAKVICDVAEQSRASYDTMCERVREVATRFDYKKLAAKEIMVIEAAMGKS